MKRSIVVSFLFVLLTLLVVSCRDPKHEHTLEKVDAVAATCVSEGTMEYYKCSDCKLVFADKEAKKEVSNLETLKTEKDAGNHTEVKKVNAVESTCTVNGSVEHWHCEGCGRNYGESTCENELASIEVPLKAHDTEKVDAVAATCIEGGMGEYYRCSVCKLTFADNEAKTEIADLETLKTEKDAGNHTVIMKVDAVAPKCPNDGMVEHWHCEGCGRNFGEPTCETELDSVVVNVHGTGDVSETGESFTVGGVVYEIHKCIHGYFFIDDACMEMLYKEYLDAAGLVVSEKDGVLDAYFSDCDVFLSTEGTSSYGFEKAVAYFTDKKFARLGYNGEDVGGLDATENKALTLVVSKDEDGTLHITGESEKDKKPLNSISSITICSDGGLLMVSNGGETWKLEPYKNPLRGKYKDVAGNVLTFDRYVMRYTLSGEESFYVADIDETHVKILSNETNSGAHGNTTFGFRQYTFLRGPNLYIKWGVDLPGVSKWGNDYYEYVPFVEE